MSDWSLDQARKTYSIPHWADGYFDVDAAGHVVVRPTGAQGPAVSLPEIVDSARATGAKLPLLVRFPDILGQRLGKLQHQGLPVGNPRLSIHACARILP